MQLAILWQKMSPTSSSSAQPSIHHSINTSNNTSAQTSVALVTCTIILEMYTFCKPIFLIPDRPQSHQRPSFCCRYGQTFPNKSACKDSFRFVSLKDSDIRFLIERKGWIFAAFGNQHVWGDLPLFHLHVGKSLRASSTGRSMVCKDDKDSSVRVACGSWEQQ